jgi:tRNA (mo5U34)-methyltransferase
MQTIRKLSRLDVTVAKFGPLVRKGLRFRRRFEAAKRALDPVPFEWYRYDSFPNLFYLQHLIRSSSLALDDMVSGDPLLDIGAADGALSFFMESLGYRVDAVDSSGTNINRMEGLRKLTASLKSAVQLRDQDLDACFTLERRYGVALFLGTLYHLKNPFYALETLARHARYCFLSTRVARLTPDRRTRLDNLPVAYLLQEAECNADTTNYFIFSPTGLLTLVRRCGWTVRDAIRSGATESDPISPENDERMYLLLESPVGAGSKAPSQPNPGPLI